MMLVLGMIKVVIRYPYCTTAVNVIKLFRMKPKVAWRITRHKMAIVYVLKKSF